MTHNLTPEVMINKWEILRWKMMVDNFCCEIFTPKIYSPVKFTSEKYSPLEKFAHFIYLAGKVFTPVLVFHVHVHNICVHSAMSQSGVWRDIGIISRPKKKWQVIAKLESSWKAAGKKATNQEWPTSVMPLKKIFTPKYSPLKEITSEKYSHLRIIHP